MEFEQSEKLPHLTIMVYVPTKDEYKILSLERCDVVFFDVVFDGMGSR